MEEFVDFCRIINSMSYGSMHNDGYFITGKWIAMKNRLADYSPKEIFAYVEAYAVYNYKEPSYICGNCRGGYVGLGSVPKDSKNGRLNWNIVNVVLRKKCFSLLIRKNRRTLMYISALRSARAHSHAYEAVRFPASGRQSHWTLHWNWR